MTTANGATFNDISNWIGETAGQAADFTSEVFERIQKEAISEAQAKGELADAFAKDFQRYSETAAKHAQNAATCRQSRRGGCVKQNLEHFCRPGQRAWLVQRRSI